MMIGSIPPQLVSHFQIEESLLKESHPKKKFKKWTEEQDQKFIELYGQGLYWEDIAAQIPGKTDEQCRDHWRRALQKRIESNGQLLELEQQRQKSIGQQRIESQKKQESKRKQGSKKWTEEDDERLIELYGQGLARDDIAKHFPGKSAQQCYDRIRRGLQEKMQIDRNGHVLKIPDKEWTEEDKLIELIKTVTGVKKISEATIQLYKTRWEKLKMTAQSWTQEEEERLITLKRQSLSWELIETYFPNRIAGECSQYWNLVLEQKSLKKRERTTEEGDRAIKKARLQLSIFVPASSPPPQAVIPTTDFRQEEASKDLVESESVSDSLSPFFDAHFPENSEDTFSATSSAETSMHHDNQIMAQEKADKSYEKYFDFTLR